MKRAIFLGLLLVACANLVAAPRTAPVVASGDAWATKAPLSVARNDHSSAVVGGQIYALGGNPGTARGSIEQYDPVADTWTNRSSVPTPRASLAAAVIDGKIYAIGGDNGAVLGTVSSTIR